MPIRSLPVIILTHVRCYFFLILLVLTTTSIIHASGVRGFVKDENGEPLAFTTIFVKQTGSGTTTNVNGNYEIILAPGKYDLVYQYLGYETVERSLEITTGFIEVNIILKSQTTVLQTVTVKAGEEDPAYTIM